MSPPRLPHPRTLGPLTRTDFVRYQGASYDMNPVHHDEPFATAAGYPAPLAVGMFPAGVCAAWASDHFGPDTVRRTRIRWKKPLFPGAVLTIDGSVDRVTPTEEGRRVEVSISATDTEGHVAVEVSMTFLLPPEDC